MKAPFITAWILTALLVIGGCRKNVTTVEEHGVKLMLIESTGEVEAFIDKKSLGRGTAVIAALEDRKFPAGSTVRIEFEADRKATTSPNIRMWNNTRFLQRWIEDGVNLEFFFQGKRLDCHTLYFKNLRLGQNPVTVSMSDPKQFRSYNSDTAVWHWDSVKYFDGPSAVAAMKTGKFDENTTILLLFPADFDSSEPEGEKEDSKMDAFLQHLATDKGVKFFLVGAYQVWGWRRDWLPAIK